MSRPKTYLWTAGMLALGVASCSSAGNKTGVGGQRGSETGGGAGHSSSGGGSGASGMAGAGGGLSAAGGSTDSSTGGAAAAGGAGAGAGGRASGGPGGTVVGGGGRGGAVGGAPASAPDAAVIDAAPATDGGATTGCPGLFCEDFEKGSIDPAVWDIQVNAGQPMPALATQAGLVAHGRYAAHFHANPNVVSYDFIITKNPPAALNGHHFGRAYFMITPMPPANHTEYIYAGTTGFPRPKYLEVASAAPVAWQLTYVNLAQTPTGEDYHSGGNVPLGKWFCLEWEFNDIPDQAAVFIDGAPSFAQNTFTFGGATTGLVGGFAAFGFGYYVWHPATYPFDIYYDDIVLDTKRVGCIN